MHNKSLKHTLFPRLPHLLLPPHSHPPWPSSHYRSTPLLATAHTTLFTATATPPPITAALLRKKSPMSLLRRGWPFFTTTSLKKKRFTPSLFFFLHDLSISHSLVKSHIEKRLDFLGELPFGCFFRRVSF